MKNIRILLFLCMPMSFELLACPESIIAGGSRYDLKSAILSMGGTPEKALTLAEQGRSQLPTDCRSYINSSECVKTKNIMNDVISALRSCIQQGEMATEEEGLKAFNFCFNKYKSAPIEVTKICIKKADSCLSIASPEQRQRCISTLD